MRQTLLLTFALLVTYSGYSQCSLKYFDIVFSKVEFYETTNKKLVLKNSIESKINVIVVNINGKDMMSIEGGLFGNPWRAFITGFKCSSNTYNNSISLYTDDGRELNRYDVLLDKLGNVGGLIIIDKKSDDLIILKK